jgi:hypothetical protein
MSAPICYSNREDRRDFSAAFGDRARVVIAIKHYAHMQHIGSFLGEDSLAAVFMDEAHATACYFQDQTENEEFGNSNNKYDKLYEVARAKFKKIIYISATPQDVINVDPRIGVQSVSYLQPTALYTGYDRCEMHAVDVDDHNAAARALVRRLDGMRPIRRENRRFGVVDEHPIVVLLKMDAVKNKQQLTMQSLIAQFGARWCILNFTGDGISVYLPESVRLRGVKLSRKRDGVHSFGGQLTDVLQALAEVGVAGGVSHIAIIGYNMVAVGISIVSHYDKPQNLHLTHMLMINGADAPCANVVQAAGRIFGNFGDDITPVLYTSAEELKKLKNAMWLYEEESRRIQAAAADSETTTRRLLRPMEISAERFTKAYHRTRGVFRVVSVPIRREDINNTAVQYHTFDYLRRSERVNEILNKITVYGNWITCSEMFKPSDRNVFWHYAKSGEIVETEDRAGVYFKIVRHRRFVKIVL